MQPAEIGCCSNMKKIIYAILIVNLLFISYKITEAAFIPSFIISAKQYSCVLTAGNLTHTVTLSPAVSTTYGGVYANAISTNSSGDGVGASDMGSEVGIELTNSTTATCTRGIDNAAVSSTIYFTAIEFARQMIRQSVQRGSSSGSITAVGSKAFLLSGMAYRGGTGILPSGYKMGAYLANSTTIGLTGASSAAPWMVVDPK